MKNFSTCELCTRHLPSKFSSPRIEDRGVFGEEPRAHTSWIFVMKFVPNKIAQDVYFFLTQKKKFLTKKKFLGEDFCDTRPSHAGFSAPKPCIFSTAF